jgi:hypothetical protein
MVAVDSQGNIVNVGYNFIKEGIPYRVVSITVPADGCIGSLQAINLTNNEQIKIYPTKFGGRWSKDLQYAQVKLPQKTKLLVKGKRL